MRATPNRAARFLFRKKRTKLSDFLLEKRTKVSVFTLEKWKTAPPRYLSNTRLISPASVERIWDAGLVT